MINKHIKNLIFCFLIIIFMLTGCSINNSYNNNPDVINGLYFNTAISITFYEDVDKETKQGCFDLCKKYENLFSANKEGSDIYKLNNNSNKNIEIDKDTYELLSLSLKYEDITKNSFNPFIYPLVSLWNICSDNPKVPSETEISKVLTNINGSIKLFTKNNKYYAKLIDSSQIDLGAIAKGYISNKLKDYLISKKISKALINLGGNVVTLNGKSNNELFNIAIQNPEKPDGTPLLTIECKNISLVSSGQYERNFTKNGIIYGHILDSLTGYPVDNDLSQVTIICEDSCMADAYSTACFVMGLDKGLEFINSQDKVSAIFVNKKGEIIYSNNFSYKINNY